MAKRTDLPQDTDTLAGSSGGHEVLIEETPLGLSAEQMSKSNPDAVAAIEQRAATAAVEADRQRRTALDAAFPDDLKFAADSYASNLSVDAAKASRHDALAAELKTLKAENAELKTRVEAGKPGFVATDGEGTESSDSGDTSLAEFEKTWAKDEGVRKAFGNSKPRFLALAKREPHVVREMAKP